MHPTSPIVRRLQIILLSSTLAVARGQTRDPAATPDLPTPGEVIERLVTHHASLDGFSVEARSLRVSKVDGRTQRRDVEFAMTFARPNRARAVPTDRWRSASWSCDGESVRTWSPAVHEVVERPAPESFADFEAALRDLAEVSELAETPAEVVTRLLGDDVEHWLTESTLSVEVVGREEVGGRQAVRIRFAREKPSRKSPRMTIELVVAWEGPPWVLSYEPDYGVYFQGSDRLAFSHRVEFTEWTLGTAPNAAFSLDLPDAARPVEGFDDSSLHDLKPTAMTGDQAPRFWLPDPTGETVSLDGLLEDGPVVLEFWNSWCDASRQGFPLLLEVRTELASEVRFVSILDKESSEEVRAFAEEFPEVGAKILLDPTGVVTRRYHHMRNPTVVVVGRDRRVAFVKPGLHDTDAEELVGSIRAALQ